MTTKKKNMENMTTAVATKSEGTQFLVASSDAGCNALRMAPEAGITTTDLMHIKVPSGGVAFWSVPGLDGDKPAPYIDVVIATYVARQKAWYSVVYEDSSGSDAPSCTSSDGVHAFGINSLEEGTFPEEHNCTTCPWNQFGSKRGKGKGKDCRDFAWLFFFEPGAALPMVLNVPPTSLKSVSEYMVRLMTGGKAFNKVVTRMSLAVKSGSTEYSQLVMSYIGELDPEDATRMDEVTAVVKTFALPSAR